MIYPTIVSIVSVGTNVNKSVRKAVESIRGIKSFVNPDDQVLINPNLVTALKSSLGFTTDPRIVKAIAEMCLEAEPSKVIIAEGSGGADTRYAFGVCGYESIVNELDVELVGTNRSETKEISIPNGETLKSVRAPKAVLQSDVLVNVPKFKV